MRNKAREYFNDCNLSYKMINIYDLYKLIKILNRNISEATSYLVMIKEPHFEGKNKNVEFRNNGLEFAALRVKADYFSDREAITFNKNGFIAFCGWADDNNTKIFTDSFVEWCDYMKEVKFVE